MWFSSSSSSSFLLHQQFLFIAASLIVCLSLSHLRVVAVCLSKNQKTLLLICYIHFLNLNWCERVLSWEKIQKQQQQKWKELVARKLFKCLFARLRAGQWSKVNANNWLSWQFCAVKGGSARRLYMIYLCERAATVLKVKTVNFRFLFLRFEIFFSLQFFVGFTHLMCGFFFLVLF